jgi:hypothetical protein
MMRGGGLGPHRHTMKAANSGGPEGLTGPVNLSGTCFMHIFDLMRFSVEDPRFVEDPGVYDPPKLPRNLDLP